MFNTRWRKRQSIGKKIHRSVWKDKNSVLGSLCSQKTGQAWKQKRPPGILGKHSTIRHIIKAEKTFQQRWNFKSLGTRRLAWVILKWSCPFKLQRILSEEGLQCEWSQSWKTRGLPQPFINVKYAVSWIRAVCLVWKPYRKPSAPGLVSSASGFRLIQGNSCILCFQQFVQQTIFF